MAIHDDDDDHDHDHGSELSEMDLRVRALQTILVEKGYVEPTALDGIIEEADEVGGKRASYAWELLSWGRSAGGSTGILNQVVVARKGLLARSIRDATRPSNEAPRPSPKGPSNPP
jgi:hypothetical protein